MRGGHYNEAPPYFEEIDWEEFSINFFGYIFDKNATESRQIHRDSKGNKMEAFINIKLFYIMYQGWENMGVAIARDNKGKPRYFKFGASPGVWKQKEGEFAAQFKGDYS